MVVTLMEGEGVMLARLVRLRGRVAVGPSGRLVVLKVGRAMLLVLLVVVVLVALGKFRRGVIRMALTTS